MTNVILSGFIASLWVAAFSVLGGSLVFFKKQYSRTNIDFLLNIAAGVMLASAFLTLINPAIAQIMTLPLHKIEAAVLFLVAVLSGMAIVFVLHLVLPHEHECSGKHGIIVNWRVSWLFVIAVTIHKFPEGLAVGVAYAGEEVFDPRALTLGIALQNVPEGLMVAVSLVGIGFGRLKAALFAGLTALMQPVGAIIGVAATSASQQFIPFGMAMAGGTMLFVIINEIIPETHACKVKSLTSLGLLLGLLLMMFMTVLLG